MRRFASRLFHRLRGADNADVDRELAFHLEMQTRRYIAEGLSPADARMRARDRLGDLTRVRQACHALIRREETTMLRKDMWTGLRQDVAFGARALARAPLFAATALLTIAIGIAANTAIFSVVQAVLLESLGYRESDRLVVIWNNYAQPGMDRAAVSAAEFTDIREGQRAFDAVLALRHQATDITGPCGAGDCEPERVAAYGISPELISLLGIPPLHGRPFTEADGQAGANPVVILTHALWSRRFGADPGIVGRTVLVGGMSRTVVGVMPPDLRFPDAPVGFLNTAADLWIPFDWTRQRNDGRGNQNLGVVARRSAGVSLERAQQDLDRIADDFRARFPNRYASPGVTWRLWARPLRDEMIGEVRPALIVLLSAVGLVLLIACANVANLMLARGAVRRRELAVRSALGATRGRLVRQLFVETGLLVTMGGALGVLLATMAVGALISLDPGNIPYLDQAGIDARVLAFSGLLTLGTGVLVGLGPAIRFSRADLSLALGETSRGLDGGSSRRRLRSALVVVEVALSAMVLIGAGLLVRSMRELTSVPVGFDLTGTAVARVSIPRARYDTPARVLQFHRELTDRLKAIPGVDLATAVYPLPMSGNGWSGTLGVDGHERRPGEPEPHAEFSVVMPDYFRALRIPLLDGRDFTSQDAEGHPPVAIVDDVIARQYWPGQSAIGKRVGLGGRPADGAWATVVGVVGHVRREGPRSDGEGQLYVPALQKPEFSLYYVARAADGAAPPLQALGGAVRAQDRDLAFGAVTTGETIAGRVLARDRFNMLSLTLFGGVALAIAAVGLYGVMAVLVAQRTREIGIRLAMGGRPGQIVRGVLGEALGLTLLGVLAGVGAALAVSRSMSSLLFGVTPTDVLTYAAIVSLVLLVAMGAAYSPARRAARIDPGDAMRRADGIRV